MTRDDVETGCASLYRPAFASALRHSCNIHPLAPEQHWHTCNNIEALFFFCPKVIRFSVRKLTGKIITDISDWTAALLLNVNHYKTTAVVEHLYCTLLHSYTNKVLTKVHIYRVLKMVQKNAESLQSITYKIEKAKCIGRLKPMGSLRTAFRFHEGHDVIQYFLPVKYQCGDIYSNSTCMRGDQKVPRLCLVLRN